MTDEPKRRGRPARKEFDDLIGGELETVAVPENPTVSSSEPLPFTSTREIPSQEPATISVPPGWLPMETAPTDRRIVVSITGDDQTSVYWRMRKIVDRKNLRYIPRGAWTDALSRLDIDFEPQFWRPYVASDYIPVPRAK